MNRSQFNDPACYLCLAGAVVASRSLTQEVASSNSTDAFLDVAVKIQSALQHLGRYIYTVRSMPVVNTQPEVVLDM